jgi:uncharacterized protein YfaS (alpha-2-macroglobulin family)
MKFGDSGRLSKPKKALLIGSIAVILIGLAAIFFFKKPKPKLYNPEFSKYIEAYTSGTISKGSTIRIHLASQLTTLNPAGNQDERKLFHFSPDIKGRIYWIDGQTAEFRPEEALKPGQEYNAIFDLNKVAETTKGLEEFTFNFKVINPGLQIQQDGPISQNTSSLDYMKITGEIKTADHEDSKDIEKFITIDFISPLKVKWQHDPKKNSSLFTIDSIKKSSNDQNLDINWSGKSIGAKEQGSQHLVIPAKGRFKVMAIKAVQNDDNYALVQLSEPVGVGQDLRGLITLGNLTDVRFTIDGSQVRVYAPSAIEGNFSVTVNSGITSINGKTLEGGKNANIVFENKLPAITISGKGTILPHSSKLVLPFESINLTAVDVTIIKIYENNIPQFFQTNNYNDASELRHVAKPVLQKTIDLTVNKSLDLHKKNRFSLDLDQLIKTEPGAMYRVTIGFRQKYNIYNCAGSSNELTENDAEENSGDYYGEKIDEDDDFWYRYNSSYPNEYRWDDRDNPCTPSYYTSERFASRNLLTSNIGLIAKRGNDNSMLVVATDLLSAKPLAGTRLDFLDYQNQVIISTTTDKDGFAKFDLTRKPFLLVAKSGDDRGYLKLDDGNSLPLSRFDVGGDVIQNGLKGYMFGERGVWRPGDSLFLSFILEDKLRKLPEQYPATMELYNPKGQLFKRIISSKALNRFYAFKFITDLDAPTGNWLAKVKVGGSVFSKTIKVETVMPNRLKINFDIGTKKYMSAGFNSTANLSASWLFGATGKNLRAKVDVNLKTIQTTFKGFEGYSFDNPTVKFESQVKTVFEGTLNDQGMAKINTDLQENKVAPGVLTANFSTKVFEAGGSFSTDNFSVPYHVFSNYYGIKTPEGNRLSGMLQTGTNHAISIVNVDQGGQLLTGSKTVEVELYKVQWRWWWEQEEHDSYANFTQNEFNKLVSKTNVTLNNGKGSWNLRINEPEWGRYLILVKDFNGGHVTGKSVYIDWPNWAQREQGTNPTEASMLSFTSDKQIYNVGDDVILTIPSGKNGRALISIESGTKVLRTFWTDTRSGQTQFKFKAEKDMAPNVFANVTLLQPHSQTLNDLPIRMYGVIPIKVEDPQTILKPYIKMANEIRPETANSIVIGEKDAKAMTYSIAIVDEGLLDLTRFKTPDPHSVFYAREGLGVKTWDLFDYVLGAWGGNLQRILSIGGDGSINRNLNPSKANRFSAVVKYIGPFALEKGQVKTHRFTLPQYIGAVRVMVVAAQDAAYGFAEKSVKVKKPLLLVATLPRVIGPGEIFTLPVTVFTTEPNLKSVSIQVSSGNLLTIGSNTRQVAYKQPGEQTVFFDLKAPQVAGVSKIKIVAQSGSETASYQVELGVRNPNPYLTNVSSATIEPGKIWKINYVPIGMSGTNSGNIEVSTIPPINLKKRLSYLMQYPHGCVEQTTSAIFPQLYLDKLTVLSESQKAVRERNVKSGISKLRNFQTSDGGMAYWPGDPSADEWGSIYAGHFLIEAQSFGYSVAGSTMKDLIKYLNSKASNWSPNTTNFYGGDLLQAYRLYVLALAKEPEIAAMNKLRAFELSVSAKWRLAAAYKLAGLTDAANNLIKGLSTEIKPYKQLGGTYGSDTRDEAMILETLTLLNQKRKAAQLLLPLAYKMGRDEWYSTQTTAYTLLAMAKFCGQQNSSNRLSYTAFIDGKKTTQSSNPYFTSTALKFKAPSLSITNTGKNVLFARLVLQGQPLAGQNNFLRNNANALVMSIHYKLLNGKAIDPTRLKQGLDFYAEVTIKNPGKMGYYEQMALTQIFPSGWEIINTRINDNESILASSPSTYKDIRDDRVLTYFNLRENETVVYKVLLNASYLGKYYLSAVQCEAMYNNDISATAAGKWVQVIK